MSDLLKFAKLGDFAVQGDDNIEDYEKDKVDCFHHRNLRKVKGCTCYRCMTFKFNIQHNIFRKQYGRPPTPYEVDDLRRKIREETNIFQIAEQGNVQ